MFGEEVGGGGGLHLEYKIVIGKRVPQEVKIVISKRVHQEDKNVISKTVQ